MISFKKIDISNISQRIKSINDNTFINSKIKSFNRIEKPSIPSIKHNKKMILYLKNKQNKQGEQNNTSMNGKKIKTEISLNKKGVNLKNLITAKKVSKTLFRNKTENQIEYNSFKKNLTELNTTSTPVKKVIKKVKKTTIFFISENNKINKTNKKGKKININPNNSLKQSFYAHKKTLNILNDDILTIQNTQKNTKITKKEIISTNNKKNEKKERKLSFDFSKSKKNLSLTDIKINNKSYSPNVIHIRNCIKNEFMNKILNEDKKDMKIKKGISMKERDKIKDKLEIMNKNNKNKSTFRNVFYGIKGKKMRNNLLSLSKNKDLKIKTKISNNIKSKWTEQNSPSKNKKIKDFQKLNNNSLKRMIFIDRLRNSTCDRLMTKKDLNIDKFDIYLKTDNNDNDNDRLMKKLSENINKSYYHNYLKYTVCAFNKIINKKKEINKNSTQHRKSKTIEKDIHSIKNSIKNKNKNKCLIIHRNTITRFNLKEKNIKTIINISNSNNSTSNTSRKSLRKIDEYTIVKELGKGSYASVRLAINKINKNKYAIKVYSKKALLDPQKKSTVNNEINILKQIDNINIVKLYEVIDTQSYLYLVMEYIEGVSLLDTIRREENHYFEEQKALKLFIQILKAIIYCQNKNICHRDIKLENILIIKEDIIKIIDFGFAVKTDRETYQNLLCGSPSYMAPEIVNKEKYIAQYSDIWSLGVLFYSMLYGRFPFKAQTQEELFKKINEAQVDFPEDIEVNDKIKILLKRIFVVVPTQRPSLQEILNDISLLIN